MDMEDAGKKKSKTAVSQHRPVGTAAAAAV